MPRNPDVYASMLGEKMKQHNTNVYLVNTGWSGGPYGVGARMDINLTRTLVDAALNGIIENVEYETDKIFHLNFPTSCPKVPSEVLHPKNTWKDKAAFDKRAKKLAREFREHFDKAYGDKNIQPEVEKQCPGK